MPAARLDMIDAHDWYERQAPGLGVRFRGEVDFQVQRIAATPLQFPEILADIYYLQGNPRDHQCPSCHNWEVLIMAAKSP